MVEFKDHIITGLEQTDDTWEFQVGSYNKDGKKNLYGIKKQAGDHTELHILSEESGYKSSIVDVVLPVEATNSDVSFRIGDYNGDAYTDLYMIKKKVAGKTEVHVLDGSKGFKGFLGNFRPLTLEETDSNVDFQTGDYNRDGKDDLFVIKRSVSGNAEVHILDAATNFDDALLRTRLNYSDVDEDWDFGVSDYNNDGKPDLYLINKQAVRSTEVHILDGNNNYQTGLFDAETNMEKRDRNTQVCVASGKFNIYAIYKQAPTNTEIHTLNIVTRSTNDIEGEKAIATEMSAIDKNCDFQVGSYMGDGKNNLYVIKRNVAGKVEVHIMSEDSSYQQYLLQQRLDEPAVDENVIFRIGDYNGDKKDDIYWIKKQAAGKTEIHILKAEDGFSSFYAQERTALGSCGDEWQFGISDYNKDGKPDVYCINRQGRYRNEVHVLNGVDNYRTFIFQSDTPMEKREAGTIFCVAKGRKLNIFGIYTEGVINFEVHSFGIKEVINSNDGRQLGELSAKYESNGEPGAISSGKGDYGGKSYGAWQLASNIGSVDKFLEFLSGKNREYYNELTNAKSKDGNKFGSNFDNAWIGIANRDHEGFLELQRQYIQEKYYDAAASMLKSSGFDINNHSWALKNVLWSTAVQHGVGGAVNIFKTVGLNLNDRDMIIAIYNERSKVDKYFYSSSKEVQESVKERFKKEKEDALRMLES